MFENAPNGHFLQDMIIFGGLRKGGHVAKGFIFEPPDLSTAAPAHLNEFQDQISLLLASLHEHQRLQVQWFCDSDYRAELLRYRDDMERGTNCEPGLNSAAVENKRGRGAAMNALCVKGVFETGVAFCSRENYIQLLHLNATHRPQIRS